MKTQMEEVQNEDLIHVCPPLMLPFPLILFFHGLVQTLEVDGEPPSFPFLFPFPSLTRCVWSDWLHRLPLGWIDRGNLQKNMERILLVPPPKREEEEKWKKSFSFTNWYFSPSFPSPLSFLVHKLPLLLLLPLLSSYRRDIWQYEEEGPSWLLAIIWVWKKGERRQPN